MDKTVSYADIANAMNFDDVVEVTNHHGHLYNIAKTATLAQRTAIVKGTSDYCFYGEGDDVEYRPYFKQYAFSYLLTLCFTDIQLPEDPDECNAFIRSAGIVEKIREVVGDEYVDGIMDDVNRLNQYRVNKLLKKDKLDKVLQTIMEMLGTISSRIDEEGGDSIIKILEESFPGFKEDMLKVAQEEIKAK